MRKNVTLETRARRTFASGGGNLCPGAEIGEGKGENGRLTQETKKRLRRGKGNWQSMAGKPKEDMREKNTVLSLEKVVYGGKLSFSKDRRGD